MLDTAPPTSRRRAARYARRAGLAVGAVAGPLWAATDISAFGNDLGMNMPLVSAVMAFGLCAVGGVLLGDALTPRPREAVRTAGLTPRRVKDHVPPRITLLLLLQALLVTVVVGIGAAMSSTDAIHRAAHAVTVACDGVTDPPRQPLARHLLRQPDPCPPRHRNRRLRLGPAPHRPPPGRRPATPQPLMGGHGSLGGVLVSTQLLAVLLSIATWLPRRNCDAGALGTVTALVVYPMGLLALATLAWSLFTLVVPRAAQR
ncbi:hypothetical protein [Streptomyces sp. GS7]|uniref:hypothetical protein n=1 Tax=Streptomyces sp. GS7 TaxID=2692234 RepID=UPI001F2F5FFE|nr:hypothetical protein [Streptomyces sp. GS7]